MRNPVRKLTLCAVIVAVFGLSSFTVLPSHASPQASESEAKAVGKVKGIKGNIVTLTTDSGTEMNVAVQESTRLLRMTPEQKSLRDATPIALKDVSVGDRMLVRGRMSSGNAVQASTALVMKQSDVAAKQEQERLDWQKRGVGGLVDTVDPAAEIVTVSTTASGGKTVVVHVSNATVIRRYAPDSVKFDDARMSTLAEIKPGDQLRARGEKNAEGTELNAEEIVSGEFRNIAGTITSVDAAKNTITVMDLATKKPVEVTVTADSQLRQMPPFVAQRIAMRLRGAPGADQSHQASAGAAARSAPPAGDGQHRPNGGGDMQQMLSRLPAVTVADLQKGEAVMMVTTEGSQERGLTIITLLSGVEPILTSPNGSRAGMLLSPWNLDAPGGGETE